MSVGKIIIGIGAFFTGRYLWSLQRARNKMVVSVRGRKENINLQGITLLLRYNIKNPTRARLQMTPPLIKLLFNGKLLASSTMQSVEIPTHTRSIEGRINIQPHKETGEIATRILIPWLSIVSISPDLMTRLKSTDPADRIKLEIESISQLYTTLGDYPFEDKTTLTL